ncbi:MAG: NRDE family protein [Rhizomicrobium sp.]
MCTVSFLPLAEGFVLAMNRDEKKSRVRAEAPRRRPTGHNVSLHPAEPQGGSWIGINHKGLALALIDWHEMGQRQGDLLSRGIVVPHLLKEGRLSDLRAKLERLCLERINPFRLIAVSRSLGAIEEWRWDATRLAVLPKPWRRQHWFSSSAGETTAQRLRAGVAAKAGRAISAGTLPWLRRLHQSHGPQRGAFSICMHRDDAQTVSYAEILAGRHRASMRYAPGPLCREKPGAPVVLAFASARLPFA